jgi:hypothetical protein
MFCKRCNVACFCDEACAIKRSKIHNQECATFAKYKKPLGAGEDIVRRRNMTQMQQAYLTQLPIGGKTMTDYVAHYKEVDLLRGDAYRTFREKVEQTFPTKKTRTNKEKKLLKDSLKIAPSLTYFANASTRSEFRNSDLVKNNKFPFDKKIVHPTDEQKEAWSKLAGEVFFRLRRNAIQREAHVYNSGHLTDNSYSAQLWRILEKSERDLFSSHKQVSKMQEDKFDKKQVKKSMHKALENEKQGTKRKAEDEPLDKKEVERTVKKARLESLPPNDPSERIISLNALPLTLTVPPELKPTPQEIEKEMDSDSEGDEDEDGNNNEDMTVHVTHGDGDDQDANFAANTDGEESDDNNNNDPNSDDSDQEEEEEQQQQLSLRSPKRELPPPPPIQRTSKADVRFVKQFALPFLRHSLKLEQFNDNLDIFTIEDELNRICTNLDEPRLTPARNVLSSLTHPIGNEYVRAIRRLAEYFANSAMALQFFPPRHPQYSLTRDVAIEFKIGNLVLSFENKEQSTRDLVFRKAIFAQNSGVTKNEHVDTYNSSIQSISPSPSNKNAASELTKILTNLFERLLNEEYTKDPLVEVVPAELTARIIKEDQRGFYKSMDILLNKNIGKLTIRPFTLTILPRSKTISFKYAPIDWLYIGKDKKPRVGDIESTILRNDPKKPFFIEITSKSNKESPDPYALYAQRKFM